MPYNKFTIEDLENKLNLVITDQEWLGHAYQQKLFDPDPILDKLLSEALHLFLGSEKARSEYIVTPVLQALHRKNSDKFMPFSGYPLNVDIQLGLNGTCDFILAQSHHAFKITVPILFIVETKKRDIDDRAIAQCGAELYAAKVFNQANNINKNNIIYGCVTSGYSWAFLKLENNILSIDPNYISLEFNNPYKVLAALQYLLNLSL